jgi:hypothetical protein
MARSGTTGTDKAGTIMEDKTMTTDTHTLAARLARADVGEEFWGRVTPHFRHHAIERWKDTLETVRRAGLAIVEAEDGR